MMMLCASTHSLSICTPHALVLHITAYAVVAKLLNLVHALIQFSLKDIMLPSSTKCEHIFEFQMIEQTNKRGGVEATKQRGDKRFALSILMSHNCIYDEVSQILDLPLNSIINFVIYGCVFEFKADARYMNVDIANCYSDKPSFLETLKLHFIIIFLFCIPIIHSCLWHSFGFEQFLF